MLYCPRCGVVLETGSSRCPLCGSLPVREKPDSAAAGAQRYPETGEPLAEVAEEVLSSAERRHVAIEILSVTLGIALVITALVDLFVNHAVTWSIYSSVGIVTVWLLSAMPLILWRHPWILFAVIAPSLLVSVFLLDLADGRLSWFLLFGLPATILFEGCVAGVGAIAVTGRRKGLNVIATILAGIAVFCLGLEVILHVYLEGRFSLSWSVIVALALVPSSALLYYLHFRVMNRASLRKLFRL